MKNIVFLRKKDIFVEMCFSWSLQVAEFSFRFSKLVAFMQNIPFESEVPKSVKRNSKSSKMS